MSSSFSLGDFTVISSSETELSQINVPKLFCVFQIPLWCDSEGRLQPVAAALPAAGGQWLHRGGAYPGFALRSSANPVIQNGRARKQPSPQLCAHRPPYGALPLGPQSREYTGRLHMHHCTAWWKHSENLFTLQPIILIYFIEVLGDQASKQFFVCFIVMENCLGWNNESDIYY